MKSAEKLEQHERVTVHQVPSLAVSPSDITPSSSGTTTPAKQDQENGKVHMTFIRASVLLMVYTQLINILTSTIC